jgi:hypothetical protein
MEAGGQLHAWLLYTQERASRSEQTDSLVGPELSGCSGGKQNTLPLTLCAYYILLTAT